MRIVAEALDGTTEEYQAEEYRVNEGLFWIINRHEPSIALPINNYTKITVG